ncbi:esterase-like activity of phytase family protein [Altererythrobacter lauratis]|uniref:Esterase-like activity of phytase family protein n=1 Tax=Alteraurantiacibacter lauratis TaxID=2054627 RepID=A0ABV7EEC7_9SPHN
MTLLLLGPIWLRGGPVTAPPEDVTVRAVEVALPARQGDFTRAGLWQLASPSMEFGGFSALLPLGDGLLRLFSDRGTRLTLAVEDGVLRHPGDRRVFAQVWDVGDFGNVRRDIESATRDPETGDYWLGFENFNAIVRYDVASNRIAARRPPEMQPWPVNGGAEALVRLKDGRFIVLPEHRGDGLLFASDPTADGAAARFRFTLPDPYYATAMAQLPDGRVLVLARGLRPSLPPFTARLYLGDPARITPGGRWPLERLLDLDTILPRENYEALGVRAQDDGTVEIWIASDDNQAALQRTLVARLIWQPAQ